MAERTVLGRRQSTRVCCGAAVAVRRLRLALTLQLGRCAGCGRGVMSAWSKVLSRFGTEARRATAVTGRWKMALPAVAAHLCIGSPYAWSLIADPMTRELGIVSSAAGDWGLPATAGVLSVTFAFQGLTAAALGNWQNRVGPTISVGAAALCFGSGLMLAGVGVLNHSLPLVYLGYGVLSGIGVGLAYTPPIQVLMEYFPDRKALASGVTVAGFGCGGLLFAPLSGKLMSIFKKDPTLIGAEGAVSTVTKSGQLFADTPSGLVEVVLSSPSCDLAQGFYAVGTGGTGVGETLLCCGALYLTTLLGSAWGLRKAPVGYEGPNPLPKPTSGIEANLLERAVHSDTVMKTPQFWSLFTTFFCTICGGMALISVAKPLMMQTFSSAVPLLVTPFVSSAFVVALSAGNLGGRLFWPSVAQRYGFRNTVHVMTLSSALLFVSLPSLVRMVAATQSATPFYGFVGSSIAIVSIMGGIYALLPAYESKKFGAKYVGSNHGRMLLASTAASIAGPGALLSLRSLATDTAMNDLLAKVDPATFQAKFGVPVSQAQELVASGTLSLPRLADLIPNTADPSIFIYDSTMYSMSALMLLAFVAHGRLRPIDPKYFESAEEAASRAPPSGGHH